MGAGKISGMIPGAGLTERDFGRAALSAKYGGGGKKQFEKFMAGARASRTGFLRGQVGLSIEQVEAQKTYENAIAKENAARTAYGAVQFDPDVGNLRHGNSRRKSRSTTKNCCV